jgi:hypothetical protein
LVPIVVPIVTTFALAVWLGIAFYAAGHPAWKSHAAPTTRLTGAEEHPETAGQARPEQAAATAAQGTEALETGASPDRKHAPSLPSRRAA